MRVVSLHTLSYADRPLQLANGGFLLSDVSALVFDLDGTISDPSLGISRCLNHALTAHGFPEMPSEWVAGQIGPPLDEAFANARPDADEALIASLIAKYRERYAEVGYAENQSYPGMVETMRTLHAKGTRLGVCTSKPKRFAEPILSLFNLLPLFEFVDGGEAGIKKREQLAGLLASRVIDSNAVMIGDRSVDIQAAQANGLRSVGVLWGFGSMSELEQAGPDAILADVGDLNRLVAKS